MAVSRPGKSAGKKGAKARGHKRPVKAALGNDPFERGAAERMPPATAAPSGGQTPALRTIGGAESPPTSAAAAPSVPSVGPPEAARSRGASVGPPEAALSRGATVAPPEAARSRGGLTAVQPDRPAAVSTEGEPAAPASLRSRLEAFESRVESAAASASAQLRDMASREAAGEHARDLLKLLAGLLPAARERLGGLGSIRSLFASGGDLDAFGMERGLLERAKPILDFLYASWWRVETRDIENVEGDGPVVVVANHGGALAWDALVLRLALLRDHPRHRELRPLLDEGALSMPIAGNLARRLGAVPATPENALQLLGQGLALGVFPEGSRNAHRPWAERYRVERFGRGGFAKLALRAGAPIVPCAILGSEETSAPFARPGWLADALGMPLLTGAPLLPLAPLGLIPLPSRWSLRFGAPIETRTAGPGAAEDRARVLDFTERARASLQQMLDGEVAGRRSVYL